MPEIGSASWMRQVSVSPVRQTTEAVSSIENVRVSVSVVAEKRRSIEHGSVAWPGSPRARPRARRAARRASSRRTEHPASAYNLFRFFSKAFISLIKGLIVPLLLSTIVVGIAQTGDIKAVGRMGAKALLYFEVVTTLALVIGLFIANTMRPGDGLPLDGATTWRASRRRGRADGWEIALHLFPSNVAQHAAEGDILPVVIFADALRHRAHAHRRAGRPVLVVLRGRREGDVQVHRHGDAPHAPRRLRRHGLQRQPHGGGARRRRATTDQGLARGALPPRPLRAPRGEPLPRARGASSSSSSSRS
jgi:hypothetical protein